MLVENGMTQAQRLGFGKCVERFDGLEVRHRKVGVISSSQEWRQNNGASLTTPPPKNYRRLDTNKKSPFWLLSGKFRNSWMFFLVGDIFYGLYHVITTSIMNGKLRRFFLWLICNESEFHVPKYILLKLTVCHLKIGQEYRTQKET